MRSRWDLRHLTDKQLDKRIAEARARWAEVLWRVCGMTPEQAVLPCREIEPPAFEYRGSLEKRMHRGKITRVRIPPKNTDTTERETWERVYAR